MDNRGRTVFKDLSTLVRTMVIARPKINEEGGRGGGCSSPKFCLPV